MRVICENCGATYKIPESKLVKEVNKATCRKCGFKMMIRRPSAAVVAGVPPPANADSAATQVAGNPFEQQPEQSGLLEAETRVQAAINTEWSDEAPTQVQADPTGPPGPGPKAPRAASSSAPKTNPVIVQSGKAPGDMVLALVATFASAGGAMLLATNIAGSPGQRVLGLGLALWGAFTCLFLLVTGSLWRQKGNVPISIALATVLGLGGSAFVEVALHGSAGFNLASIPSTPEISKNDEEPAAVPDDADAADALTLDAENADPAELSEPKQDAAPSEPAKANPAAATDRRRTSQAPSTERNALPPPEEEPDDFEELEDPDFDNIEVASSSQSQAEENRRAEMEAAAQARAAQREREEREDESRRKREEQAARAAAERATAAKAAAATRAASKPQTNSSAAMKTLPLTVVDTMVRSNMSIKRCFFNEKQASGAMPRRVNVRFTVLNTGRVSSARVTTDQYKGGTLDSCLGKSFKAIQFPPFQGEAKSMTYPFVL